MMMIKHDIEKTWKNVWSFSGKKNNDSWSHYFYVLTSTLIRYSISSKNHRIYGFT